jgi:membrane-bound serine protease (ClpP class)
MTGTAPTMALIITLLALGAILINLETILPGMIAGIAGFLSLVAAVVLGYAEFGFPTGNLILGGVLVSLVTGTLCRLKFFPRIRIAKRSIFARSLREFGVSKRDLVNCTGVTITQLLPSGAAFINGKRVDVVAEGALIDRGASIKVMAVEGARVVVREV